ncbi:uncharacterized protein I303_105130 [Kwoniella dejecticola CBS 10117]|uniref:Nuclear envelope-endoplasmic reticulum network protein n=1 Tax=Kwoniella dejecticola CBS 10117 TaxID=1296121 RepID=A0A1A6A3D5_9TREE|nr:nuclear envelope-endoplasmic reticulum network protein [Kwoniella dejecticola CBS 10117]OBR84566.1 nuclear envelope-endoplasmic reticulum network protein [Kwoniella dejecticola CBS 10117]
MNTLSRLDSYVFSFFSFASPAPSASSSSSFSKTPLVRTVTPPNPPSTLSNSSASASPSPRLSNLPPTPRPKSRRRPTPSTSSTSTTGTYTVPARRKRPKGIITTYSSIKVPPPTTPILLRIALVLWSILLSFWTSLVGETRSGRSRTRTHTRIRRSSKLSSGAVGVGVLRELGESLMVSAGISEGNDHLHKSKKSSATDKDGEIEIEGSGSEIERELNLKSNSNETSEEEDEEEDLDENWIDPLVTRAPSTQESLDAPPPSDDDFASATIDDEKANNDTSSISTPNHANFTFRLKSATPKHNPSLDSLSPSFSSSESASGTSGGKKNPAFTSFQRPPSPTSILSNPLAKNPPPSLTLPISAASDHAEDKDVDLNANIPTSTTPKKSSILANPISTSILDPTVLAPKTKADSSIFRKPHNILNAALPVPRVPRAISTTPFHLQKTLILDLDETLIHSTSRPLKFASGGFASSGGGGILGLSLSGLGGGAGGKFKSNREGHSVEVVLNGRSTMYHVYKRPYVDHFLKKVASWYTLVIFTASMPEYADPVIEWLDAGRNLFARRLYRESCHLQPNGSYIKDLALVEKDLSRVCFMDNSPVSYNWNKANALPIEGWTSDPNDEALLQSIPVLDSLRFVNDVRRVLGIRGFT